MTTNERFIEQAADPGGHAPWQQTSAAETLHEAPAGPGDPHTASQADTVGAVGDVGDVGAWVDPNAVASEGEEFVLDWLRRLGVRCLYNYKLTWNRDAVDPGNPLSRVARQVLSQRKLVRAIQIDAARDGVKLSVAMTKAVVSNWMDEQRRADAQRVFTRIDLVVRRPSTVEKTRGRIALERLLALRLDEDPRYAAAVSLTMFHQIKRKLLGLPVDHHLALMIHSRAGGSGKSQFCKALLSPLEALAINTTLDECLDERSAGIWSMYAIYLDDVDESAARSKGQLRRRISLDEWMTRILGTGEAQCVPNNATLVGSTHLRIGEIMPDPYSMRRFAELHARETPPDAEAIAAVDGADWFAIWRSVDPWGPRPVDELGFADALRARQEEARVKPPVEQWLCGFGADDPGYRAHLTAAGWIRSGDLFRHCYMPYAQRCLGSEGQITPVQFGRDLTAMIKTRGPLSPLESRKGRGSTEYRVREAAPDRPTSPTSPTPSTPPTLALPPPRPEATHH